MAVSTDRQLVTVETVSDVLPIPDADAIEVVTVRRWRVVTKSGSLPWTTRACTSRSTLCCQSTTNGSVGRWPHPPSYMKLEKNKEALCGIQRQKR